jgi:hypothetical protein
MAEVFNLNIHNPEKPKSNTSVHCPMDILGKEIIKDKFDSC